MPTKMQERHRLVQLIGPAELADHLGLTVQTIYTWRTRGLGPRGFRVGKHVRYRLEDVEDWLERQAAASKTPAE